MHTVPLARPETLPSTSTDAQEEEDEDDEIVGPMPPAMSRTDDTDLGERFLEMKEQWAQQEEANLEKGSIHYQDVLFNGKYRQLLFVYTLRNCCIIGFCYEEHSKWVACFVNVSLHLLRDDTVTIFFYLA